MLCLQLGFIQIFWQRPGYPCFTRTPQAFLHGRARTANASGYLPVTESRGLRAMISSRVIACTELASIVAASTMVNAILNIGVSERKL